MFFHICNYFTKQNNILIICDRGIQTFAKKAHGVIGLKKLAKTKLKQAKRTANLRFIFYLFNKDIRVLTRKKATILI